MSNRFIRPEEYASHLARTLVDEMNKTAEPLVQGALEKIEGDLRRRLAEMVVGLVTSEYNIQRHGMTLNIRVNLSGGRDET